LDQYWWASLDRGTQAKAGREPITEARSIIPLEKQVFSVTIFNCKKPYLGLLVAGSLGIIPEDHVAENGNARSD
jgi:hypothetical protein